MTSETVLNDAPVHLETGFDYDDLGFGDRVPDGDGEDEFPTSPHDPPGICSAVSLLRDR